MINFSKIRLRTSAGSIRKVVAVGVTAAMTAVLAACGGGNGNQPDNVISYWLWDSTQQPGYQQCADAFKEENPELTVQITQYGWDDYWQKLTAGFIADQAPDVFTNHLTKYPQFVDLEVLQPLEDLQATADIDNADFQPGLGELWTGQDGSRYGTPKDWDSVGLFYNEKMLDEAGIDPEQLDELEWNPEDGGTFEDVIAHLTVDKFGKRGDEEGFDKNNIAVYGMGGGGAGDFMAQTTWGSFAVSNGWQFMDQNPWGTQYNYGDEKLQETLSWYFGLADKGYMPTYEAFSTDFGAYNQFAAGQAALVQDGAWQISSYSAIEGVDWSIAPMPIGPVGKRMAPYNGLADSITNQADNPEAAAKWVAFLAGEECQDIIGEEAVVFPARPSGTEIALRTREENGIEASVFTDLVENEEIYFLPVSSFGADITAIMTPGLQAIFIGEQPVSYLEDLNEQVNRLFELG
jgi:multiple sugar transport system substrate-binding protein